MPRKPKLMPFVGNHQPESCTSRADGGRGSADILRISESATPDVAPADHVRFHCSVTSAVLIPTAGTARCPGGTAFGTSVPHAVRRWLLVLVCYSRTSLRKVRAKNFNGRGDFFIVGLLATQRSACGPSPSRLAAAFTFIFFALFVLSSAVLFGSVFIKVRHMFSNPQRLIKRRLPKPTASQNLPTITTFPTQLFKRNSQIFPIHGYQPGYGLNWREPPRHY